MNGPWGTTSGVLYCPYSWLKFQSCTHVPFFPSVCIQEWSVVVEAMAVSCFRNNGVSWYQAMEISCVFRDPDNWIKLESCRVRKVRTVIRGRYFVRPFHLWLAAIVLMAAKVERNEMHRVPSSPKANFAKIPRTSKKIICFRQKPCQRATLLVVGTTFRRSHHNDAPVTGLSFALSSSTLASKLLQSSTPFPITIFRFIWERKYQKQEQNWNLRKGVKNWG
jgi:hypothetical protein